MSTSGCTCLQSFYGSLCEFIEDIIITVQSTDCSVRVKLGITNWKFTKSLADPQSGDFRKFEEKFKAEMSTVYSQVSGYTNIKVFSVKSDNFAVYHEIIAKLKITGSGSLARNYYKVFHQVKKSLETLKKQHCIRNGNTTSLCVGDSITLTPIQPLSGDDFCSKRVPSGFNNFYSSYFSSEGLNCVSECHQKSPKYLNCSGGTCLLSRTGPQCLCPRTDLYLYTSPDCTVRMPRSSQRLPPTGALITVLLVVVVILCIRRVIKKKATYVPPYMK
ncbi:mucin-17-like [Engystomops pustulosus]|uniref:mucin-17-like n=1 Tax=Engystomops pustulosus TaxID=76066 RepID=UPI003AFA87AF